MSIYQSIKDFGKKALVVGGLVAFLSGCGKPKVNQVLADVNRDGKKDIVNYMFDGWFSHDIYVSLNSYGRFREAKKIVHLEDIPIELHVDDLSGDEIPDISYVVFDVDGWTGWAMYMAKGNGDGTFQNPVKIRHYKNRPQ